MSKKNTDEAAEGSLEAVTLLRFLGDRLRRLRLAQNRSQEELAAASGIGMSTLKRLERGQGCHLSALAEVLVQLQVKDRCEEFLDELVQDARPEDTSRLRASRSRK